MNTRLKSVTPPLNCSNTNSTARCASETLISNWGRLLLRLQEPDQRVFHFAAGLQHGLLILQRFAIEPRILRDNVVADAAVIEDIPLQVRHDKSRKAAGIEQLAKVVRGNSQEAVQR